MKEQEVHLGWKYSHNISNLTVSSKFTDFKIQEIIPTSTELKLLI